jgi:hypothetical protein
LKGGNGWLLSAVFHKMGHERGLHTAGHVEQIIASHITARDAREVFIPAFLILLFHLRQLHQAMKAAKSLDEMQAVQIDFPRDLRQKLGDRKKVEIKIEIEFPAPGGVIKSATQ